jgi:hypothetical protein
VPFSAVIGRRFAVVALVQWQITATTSPRFDKAQYHLHRDGRINRMTTPAQYPQTRFHRSWMGRGHHHQVRLPLFERLLCSVARSWIDAAATGQQPEQCQE